MSGLFTTGGYTVEYLQEQLTAARDSIAQFCRILEVATDVDGWDRCRHLIDYNYRLRHLVEEWKDDLGAQVLEIEYVLKDMAR